MTGRYDAYTRGHSQRAAQGTEAPAIQTLADSEREHVTKALEKTDWRIKGPKGAATLLGLKPSTLYKQMRKLGIPGRRQKENATG
jgi:formate hydrogenlyase transcriptional activator